MRLTKKGEPWVNISLQHSGSIKTLKDNDGTSEQGSIGDGTRASISVKSGSFTAHHILRL